MSHSLVSEQQSAMGGHDARQVREAMVSGGLNFIAFDAR